MVIPHFDYVQPSSYTREWDQKMQTWCFVDYEGERFYMDALIGVNND